MSHTLAVCYQAQVSDAAALCQVTQRTSPEEERCMTNIISILCKITIGSLSKDVTKSCGRATSVFWRENMIAVDVLLRVSARMS